MYDKGHDNPAFFGGWRALLIRWVFKFEVVFLPFVFPCLAEFRLGLDV